MLGDYEARREFVEKFKEEWNRRLEGVSEELLDLVKQIEKEEDHEWLTVPEEALELIEDKGMLPSRVMWEYYGGLVKLYVPEKHRKAYFTIIDKLNQFSFAPSTGLGSSCREDGYGSKIYVMFRLLLDYKILEFYGGNLAAYLRKELPEELLEFRSYSNLYAMRYAPYLIAGAIDAKDEEVIQAVKEMLGEGEAELDNAVLSGIVKCSDRSLLDLLGRFLLAAGNQDGLRKMVCRVADSGTREAFAYIFGCICENKLYLHGSVKLTLMEIMDIWDSKGLDLIMGKYGVQLQEALLDKEKAEAFCHSSDRILIYIGLWAMGKCCRQDTIAILREFIMKGTKDQRMIMAYTNRSQWDRYECRYLAEQMLGGGEGEIDLELTAAYWRSFCLGLAEYRNYRKIWKEGDDGFPEKVFLYYFDTKDKAMEKVNFLHRLLEEMPAKEVKFQPCIFPWHSEKITVSGIWKQLCLLAHMLEDEELADEVLEHLGEIRKSANMGSRADYAELLLRNPTGKKQVDKLVSLLADKESDTRKKAAELLEGQVLEDVHYGLLEGYLRLKNGEIRRLALEFLKGQQPERIASSVERLIASEDRRMQKGGLDLALETVKEETAEPQLKEKLRQLVSRIEEPEENEKILLRRILGENTEKEPAAKEEGYGLYREDAVISAPEKKADRQAVTEYFRIDSGTIDKIVQKLADMVHKNAGCSCIDKNGEEIRLDDYLEREMGYFYGTEMPFRDLWEKFYSEEIGDVRLLTIFRLTLRCGTGRKKEEKQESFGQWKHKLLGRTVTEYVMPEGIGITERTLWRAAQNLADIFGTGELGKIGMEMFRWMLEDMEPEQMWHKKTIRGRTYWNSFLEEDVFWGILRAAEKEKGAESFANRFYLYAGMDEKYGFQRTRCRKYSMFSGNHDLLDIEDYVKAFSLGLIEEDIIYKKIMEVWGPEYTLDRLEGFEEGSDTWKRRRIEELFEDSEEENRNFMEAGHHIYGRLVNRILKEELSRGEMPTVFSEYVWGVNHIYGMEHFVELLKALGDGKLDRNRADTDGKAECLSRLLLVCTPKEGDNGGRLRDLLTDKTTGKVSVPDKRLTEAGMYAPQWLGVLEEYFGIPGFRSGCCYFIAHMAGWLSPQKQAMIARYTPLSAEELAAGAFDSGWFFGVYEILGEEKFRWLYDAAKYISDGSKHVRARKYADAALGRVTAEELEARIEEKRNKDLLMSYGLVPFRDKSDMFRRYEFLQRFRKESRNYGSRRRVSEAEAVNMALRNMATMAGYADTMRLTLAMEGEAAKEYGKYMEWHTVADVQVRIEIDAQGIPAVVCEKEGKTLKSVPARLKKEEWMAAVLKAYKKLKEQSRRCTRMFEQAMKDREKFSFGELLELNKNPIAAPVAQGLVFIPAGVLTSEGKGQEGESTDGLRSGYFTERGLLGPKGQLAEIPPATLLLVAHPIELFAEGTLEAYQRGCYDAVRSGTVRKQPFKQIYREFYLKLEEELEQPKSRAFSGYQVEPVKALACLKGQGWIADVEEGIQKICYGQNMIAGIRVLSDWVTAEDLMTPSIDWVDFYDRLSHEQVCMKDVPDVVYSEIMRDVDLAVSVAYVGGVDPETCRSTMEMRKVIAEYNLSLFGITNVKFVRNHAVIQGKRAAYTVHMGSGVVHRKGGPQINIKAVPAQKRGRIFLPFVEEDPKTAEILSKIILFAADDKIKDSEILRQI